LGREFVDDDELISAREGKSIAQIFADEGALYFRMRESELCRELAQRNGLAIATGGGALVDDANRAALARNAKLFCLAASPATIAQRLEGDTRRPLLDERDETQTVIARIAELLARREAAYALIPYHVSTDGLSAEQVAAQIVSRAQQDVTVDLQREV